MKRLLSLWNRYVRFVQFRSHKATFIDMEKIQKDKSYKMKNIMLILEFLLILTFMIASIYLMTNAIIVGVFAHIFFISFCLWWVYEIYGLWKDFFNRIKNEKNT